MMTEFEAYQNYLALKLHFLDSNYDYIKYNGKVSASVDSFKSRKDKYQFLKLSKKLSDEQITEYYIANFIRNKKWIGEFDQQNWNEHKRITQSLEYIFINDVEKLLTLEPEFDIIFNCDKGNHPKLLKAYLGKKICLETLVIFEKLLHYRKQFDREITETFIWPNTSRLIEKYEPFVEADVSKCKLMLIEKVKELK